MDTIIFAVVVTFVVLFFVFKNPASGVLSKIKLPAFKLPIFKLPAVKFPKVRLPRISICALLCKNKTKTDGVEPEAPKTETPSKGPGVVSASGPEMQVVA